MQIKHCFAFNSHNLRMVPHLAGANPSSTWSRLENDLCTGKLVGDGMIM